MMLRSAMLAARSSTGSSSVASPLRLGVAATGFGIGSSGSSTTTPRFASAAPRLFSTSSILAARTTDTGPTVLSEGHNMAPPFKEAATLTKQSAEAMAAEQPEQLQTYPDYSKGPSALDKASQLFFFTEILRGKL